MNTATDGAYGVERAEIAARVRAGRCYWDVDRWLEYGSRLHHVLGRLDYVGRRLPPTPGWKARDTDILIGARQCIEVALVRLERVIVEHFGGRWEGVPGPINGFPQHWFDRPEIRPRPWTRRPGPTSREDWISFGAAIKESKLALQGCSCVFSSQCRGRDRKPHLAALAKAIAWVDRAKCRLDSLVCEQHPDWPDATKVFYGQGAPRLDSEAP